MMLEALLFDLDGVITDTAEFHYQAWQRLADELSISFNRERNQLLRGIGRMESLDIILEKSAKVFSPAQKAELADTKNAYYKSLILDITPSDILPGMERLLSAAKERGIKMALASASANGPTILERLGISDMLQYVVDPSKLTKGKPDPEIFLKAAAGLGVHPSHCVGLEDAHAGIAAIKGAGMYAVGIGAHLHDAPCDWRVEETSEISLDEIVLRVAKAS
ncbi:MAG: beta-phosphoglucomutase [Pseudomonadota bacterium]|jgi:beta-phosphoglucomutase